MSSVREAQRGPFSKSLVPSDGQWVEVNGVASPHVVSDFANEYAAIRTGVGVLDYSHLYRWQVQGAAAVDVVDSVVSRAIRGLPDGKLAYAVIVDDDGYMVDDVLVGIQGRNSVVVMGNDPDTEHVLHDAAPAHTSVSGQRNEVAVLSLQGPKSRELLTRLTDVDVSGSALPYYSFVSASVAGIPAVVNRVGFSAEVGYEVVVPRGRADLLWDAVMSQGHDLGVLACGTQALKACRLEAGMLAHSSDYDRSVSPYSCRMAWSLDFDRRRFRGREALMARRHRDVDRLVSVRADAPPETLSGSAVLTDSGAAGIVTSAVTSPALGGATLAFARVHRDVAGVGTVLQAVVDGGPVDIEVVATPVYDPQRTRVRS